MTKNNKIKELTQKEGQKNRNIYKLNVIFTM